ncbi:hypothetical protein FHR84_002386 [Actinopolyspora biskrensis]|uniref:Uncharacterized protein n=1 Tax=Actinopolyspora biskrensis TaxID=1470178 RepID=A0A852YZ90_9ACTN|nr:hypothetical protein [Actinopolyspora biskrensis]NYH79052.1 hypothetical protein [Actinopolyspora biskrensis]
MKPADRSFLLRFREAPASLEHEIRTTARALGAISVLLAVLTGILVPVLWGTANFVLMVESLGALVLLLSGSVLLGAPSCLARGYLTLALTERIRRITLFCWILTVVLAVLVLTVVLGRPAPPAESSPAALVLVLLLAAAAPVSAGFGHFGTRRLFPHHRNASAPPHAPASSGTVPGKVVEFPNFVSLSARETRRLRKASTWLGGVSVVLSGANALALPVLAYWLPTGPYAFTSSAVLYAVMTAMMALYSAIMVLTGRGCVATGRLDVPRSTVRRGILLTPLILTAIMASSCYAMLTANVDPPSQAVFGYTALLFVAVLLAGVDYFVGRALFPSAATLLRRFGPPPHWPRR